MDQNSETIFCLEPLLGILAKKTLFLGFRMRFTDIYHNHIPTKLNIHQWPLNGEVIRTEIEVPERCK